MKKLVFNMLAIVTFSFNGFASSEDANEKMNAIESQNCNFIEVAYSLPPDNCFYTITVSRRNDDGTWTITTTNYSTFALSSEDCEWQAAQHARRVRSLIAS
uniref:hypothetical protein n=2 Tax=Flavobacterium sp. TaxID=239 RepID=UPI0040492CAB